MMHTMAIYKRQIILMITSLTGEKLEAWAQNTNKRRSHRVIFGELHLQGNHRLQGSTEDITVLELRCLSSCIY